MKINRFVTTVLAVLTLFVYIEPANAEQYRQVIKVRNKKHIPRFVWVGLDTYGNPTKVNQPEQFILQFNDVNGNPLSGFLSVNRNLYNETWMGRQFTRSGNKYYFCRPIIDRCNSFKH